MNAPRHRSPALRRRVATLVLCLGAAPWAGPVRGEGPVREDGPVREQGAPASEESPAGVAAGDAAGSRVRAAARTFVDDGKYLFTFPARPTRRGVWTTAAVVAGTALLIGRDDAIRRENLEHDSRDLDRAADRIEPLGKEWVAGAAIGAVWLLARTAERERAASSAATAFEALLWTTLTTSAAKGLFGRERPADGVDPGGFWEGDTIFPSGHTSRSFAVAAVFADRYGRTAAWIGYPLAGLVGLSTARRDTHWVSDVLAGAGLGLAIGRGIAARHPWRDPGGGGALDAAPRDGRGRGRPTLRYLPGRPGFLRLTF
ncbi:MAG: phosphatase PAP2 family protein [Candidatus Polarisedimenticolia bacterium]